MPDTPKPKKPTAAGNPTGLTKEQLRDRFKPSSVDREVAMLRYLGMKKPSVRQLHRELLEEGHRITEGTLLRWKAKYRWTTHMDTQRKVMESEILGVITLMNKEGAQVTELAFKGAQARLIAHLGRAINKVECKTPKDVNDLLEACERLRAMTHTIRGDQFGEVRKTGDVVANGPQVSLGSFKPKIVGAKTNGNGEAHE